jgi:hypothetical protein
VVPWLANVPGNQFEVRSYPHFWAFCFAPRPLGGCDLRRASGIVRFFPPPFGLPGPRFIGVGERTPCLSGG